MDIYMPDMLNHNGTKDTDHEERLEQEAIKEDLSDAVRHGILVSNLAVMLSKELGETDEFLSKMALAGFVHDIGKLKLGKYLYGRNKHALKIEEMKYVRMHSSLGADILNRRGYEEFILGAVRHHHENFDGSGYPDNLKGEHIPWPARILRACDVYAALISDRPYREAFDSETAAALMIDEVKNFDMRVFLAFLSIMHSDEFHEMKENSDICKYINNNDQIGAAIIEGGIL